MSPTFSLFLFSTPTASHTLTVQYSISVPSFPNVRARNSPQEQDEEQWVWDRWACWLRSDTDVWECQTLQCSSLVHLQACTQTPAHSAGQSQCTLVIVVVVLRGIRTIWLMYVMYVCVYIVYISYYLSRWRERSFCREMMTMETACSLLLRLTPVAQKEKGLHFVTFCFLNSHCCFVWVWLGFCFQPQEEHKEKQNESPLSCCDWGARS